MKRITSLILVLSLYCSTNAQLRITSTEKLPLDKSKQWSNPQFSPDGTSIYFTTMDYQGIWKYSIATKSSQSITDDARSGFGFVVSADGMKLAYRRTLNEKSSRGRVQEVVVRDLSKNSAQVLASGSNLSTPSFAGSTVLYSEDISTKNLEASISSGRPIILGIENTKIALVENGKKRLLDPLGNGSYIWPMLSPDARKLVASDMSRGTFISDLKGNVLTRFGKRNAAVWTRDGKWLISMNDKDDGHNIISSDLFCTSSHAQKQKQLTFTADVIELYPQCSPVENKIVCSTLDGDILVLTYEEMKR